MSRLIAPSTAAGMAYRSGQMPARIMRVNADGRQELWKELAPTYRAALQKFAQGAKNFPLARVCVNERPDKDLSGRQTQRRTHMTERTGLTCGRAICGVLMMLAALPLQAQESVIYNFQGGNDGSKPTEGFEVYKSSLYGTLIHGGSASVGEVFWLAPPTTGTTWTKRALYNFGAPGNYGPSQNSQVLLKRLCVLIHS